MKGQTQLPLLDNARPTAHELLNDYAAVHNTWYNAIVQGADAASGEPASAPGLTSALGADTRRAWVRYWHGIKLFGAARAAKLATLEPRLLNFRSGLQQVRDELATLGAERDFYVDVQSRLDAASTPPDRQLLWTAVEPDLIKYAGPGGAKAVGGNFVNNPVAAKKILGGKVDGMPKRRSQLEDKEATLTKDVAELDTQVSRLTAYSRAVSFSLNNIAVTVDHRGWVLLTGRLAEDVKYNALAQTLTAAMLARADVLGERSPANLSQALQEQATRVRGLVNGTVSADLTWAEVAVACAWFGSEVLRNPRSFGMGLMMLELLHDRTTYGSGGTKTYSWTNVLAARMQAGEDEDAWLARMEGHGRVPGGPDAPAGLDVWGGKHPMAHKNSEAEGGATIGVTLNVVQIKEVSLLAHWITKRGITTWDGLRTQLRTLLG